jgi:hypothetical protein
LGEAPDTLVMWLMEVPAHDDAAGPAYSTESWSCFLHDAHARQLRDGLVAALAGERPESAGLRLPPLQPRSLRRTSPASPASPATPDVAGGYADYAGWRAVVPAFSRDEDDDPPTLTFAAPKGA